MATLASPAVGTSVRAASAAWLGRPAQAAPVRTQGVEALVLYRSDRRELARRHRVAAGRLDNLEPLQTLLHLPVGLPVAHETLPEPVRQGLRRLPAGAIEHDGDHVIRHAVRPLAVDLAVVRATSSRWHAGLQQAGRFAPFCARALCLDRLPEEREEMLMEAAFYGIGVMECAAGEADMVLEPRSYRPARHTAAAWCFAEELHQRLR